MALSGFAADGPVSRIIEVVDEARAKIAIEGLRQALRAATIAVNSLTPTTLPEAFLNTPLGIVIRYLSPDLAASMISDHKKAALKALQVDGQRIDRLAGEWWDAAKRGQDADGATFSWSIWVDYARTILSDIVAQVKYQAGANVFVNAARFISDVVATIVKMVVNAELPKVPASAVPWWVWAAGGVVAAGALMQVAGGLRIIAGR